MPLVIQAVRDRTGPVVVCDHCRAPIGQATAGVLLWRPVEGGSAPPVFVHAGCLAAFEAGNPGTWYTADLDTAMEYLSRALRMTGKVWRRAAWKARMLDQV